MQIPALPLSVTASRRLTSRTLVTLILALTLLAPLFAVCGCGDVEGAASNTAGQFSEREKRNREATDIIAGTPKSK